MKLFNHMVTVEDGVLFSAFRYSLGRRTYVVQETVEAIIQNADAIQPKLVKTMINEITAALATEHGAGMDMDRDQWIRCRKALQQSLMSTGRID